MLGWSYKVGFLGTLIGVVKMVASIAQGTSPCAQSARRQRPCCRLLRVEFILQNEYASYTGRSGRASVRSRRSAGRGFFQLQMQTCQKIWTLRALVFEARLLLPSFSSKVSVLVQSACGGQADFIYSSIHREATFRQLPKAADD